MPQQVPVGPSPAWPWVGKFTAVASSNWRVHLCTTAHLRGRPTLALGAFPNDSTNMGWLVLAQGFHQHMPTFLLKAFLLHLHLQLHFLTTSTHSVLFAEDANAHVLTHTCTHICTHKHLHIHTYAHTIMNISVSNHAMPTLSLFCFICGLTVACAFF